MVQRIIQVVTFLLISGCSELSKVGTSADVRLFDRFGWTIFSNPGLVTMKEIHLDKGLLGGQSVVIEGDVVELGKYNTHMVVSDNTARMLVVLTDVYWSLKLNEQIVGKKVKILGSVEDGKKGLPFVFARSFKILDDSSIETRRL